MGAADDLKQNGSSSNSLDALSASLLTARRNADALLQKTQSSQPMRRIKSGIDSFHDNVRAELDRISHHDRRRATDDTGAMRSSAGQQASSMRRVRSSVDVRRYPRPSRGKDLASTGLPGEETHDWLQSLTQSFGVHSASVPSSRPLFPSVSPPSLSSPRGRKVRPRIYCGFGRSTCHVTSLPHLSCAVSA